MLILSILIIPLIGIFTIATDILGNSKQLTKYIGLFTSIINLVICLVIFMLFDFSNNQFQFVQEHYELNGYNIFFGVDGLSIYFVLLTAIIMPIAILSNWVSINDNVKWYINIVLLLETLLLAVFLVLDIFLFYISFESILPPLFLLIGIFGSSNKVRASFYLFLYTLLGSLFLLLSILTIRSIMGTTDYYALFKTNFDHLTQLFLFYGVFIAFAVKTPTIFLNTWLLKAHVESPLGGSIILAAIVLKLSLYGILRLILPILPKASLDYTYIIYLIGVITIIYASFSTLRTVDVKELIAYSSVSHAAVYLIGVFSNTLQGIGGGILLGLAHGFVSSGLFICTGGVLYDRSSTRLITYYRGVTQIMPLFSIVFFILCLSNAGTPLSLNFVGEFLSLYGTFERLPILGALASTSIILSAAYTMYMFNRISFGGKLSNYFKVNMPDLNKREFIILLILIIFTVVLGIYPAVIIDGFNFSVSTLIYSFSSVSILSESYDKLSSFSYNTTPSVENIHEMLHESIIFYTLILSISVTWLITSILWYFINRSYYITFLIQSFLQPKIILSLLLFISMMSMILNILFNIINSDLLEYFINIQENILLASPLDPEGSSNETTPSNQKGSNLGSGEEPSNNAPNNSGDDNNDDDDSVRRFQEDEAAREEGLREMARHEERIANCDHRTRDRQFVVWSEDMKDDVECDYCHNPIKTEGILCNNCWVLICENCDHMDIHQNTYGVDESDRDSSYSDGEDGNLR